MSFLDQNVPDYISKDDWPANSPDLNPLDYSVWGAMDELVYRSGHKINDIESLKMAIKAAWETLSQNYLNKATDQWHLRLNLCVENKGGHIEHLL